MATAVDTADAAGTDGAKPLISPPTRGPVANTHTSDWSWTRRSMPTTVTSAPPPRCVSSGCHANICGGWINSNCTGTLGRASARPAPGESQPSGTTGKRPSVNGSDAGAHSSHASPEVPRRRPRVDDVPPNAHPTTPPADKDAGDGVRVLPNVAKIPFEAPKIPPPPGTAAGGMTDSSVAGWT